MSTDILSIECALRVDDFDLEISKSIEMDGCLAIFGPSGAGKSTLLRLIAGLARPDRGRIVFRAETWCDTQTRSFVPAHQRPVGVVFQDGRLFPHLTVQGNLQFADHRCAIANQRYTYSDIVETFDLTALLNRKPESLSGGERQRVAIARALLTRPALFLLDEPLSGLDGRRKSAIIPYLDDLPKKFRTPTIYVSHDVDEVVRLADQTMILESGRVRAIGPTRATLNNDSISNGAVLDGIIIGHDDHYCLTQIQVGGGVLSLPINREKRPGDHTNIWVDAKNVTIASTLIENISIRNTIPATISEKFVKDSDPFIDVRLNIPGGALRAQITRAAWDDMGLAIGKDVYALIKSASFNP